MGVQTIPRNLPRLASLGVGLATILLGGCGHGVALTEPQGGGVAVEANGRFLQVWGLRAAILGLGLIGISVIVWSIWVLKKRRRALNSGDAIPAVWIFSILVFLFWWPIHWSVSEVTRSSTIVNLSSEAVEMRRCHPFHCVGDTVPLSRVDAVRYEDRHERPRVFLDLHTPADSWLVVRAEESEARQVHDMLVTRLDDYVGL